MMKKQYHQGHHAKRQKTALKPPKDGSNEEVLLADVKSLLRFHKFGCKPEEAVTQGDDTRISDTIHSLPERFSEIKITILELSSTGDGLGVSSTSDHIYVVPFTIPGDIVQAKVITQFPEAHYTLTDFVNIVAPGPQRDEGLVKCRYFTKCGGCQIQMLPYEAQLRHKKTIVEKAFHNFSTLTPEAVPPVSATIGSPLQYGYRTKLTPHFDGPPGSMSRKAKRDPASKKGFEIVPPIGFMLKGTRKTIDIEDCPIGTDAVREGMRLERTRVTDDIANYTKGATILLRETTSRKPRPELTLASSQIVDIHIEELPKEDDVSRNTNQNINQHGPVKDDVIDNDPPSYIEEKTCITDQKAISTEYVGDYVFRNTAGAFFQNNNSTLPKFIAYVRENIIDPAGTTPIKYLIDAYCGSGLFTVTLSSLFESSMGIDIAGASIVSARENATANNLFNTSFMAADASKLFEKVRYPAEETVVIIDPPRKGCDEHFLQQLLRFGPQRIIYVSCNVHTQARDVGRLVEGSRHCRYEIESLQGFDFFPQTGHVEGVAILSRVKQAPQ